jgi:serine/threonine protein kinase/Tol biopolymer transport system component
MCRQSQSLDACNSLYHCCVVDTTGGGAYHAVSFVRLPFPAMIGQILDHYRIVEKIGAGGMGEVYRALDDRLGREVAIKVLKPALANDQDRLRRFELEARSAAALSHPSIVAIYDIGTYDGFSYIVSELLQGQTLRQRLMQGPLALRQAADFGMQIAQGLMAAHEKRIIHRDLKPENLFLTRDGRVKILDFGIAKLAPIASGEEPSVESMTTQTKAGSVLGTVSYMSPEQIRGKAVDHRSDIFSLGAILYEMLIAERAFHGETEVDTMMAVLKEDVPEIVRKRQSVPGAFDQIVHHCLEKDPENRFQSARDLSFALSTVSDLTSKQFVPVRNYKKQVRKLLPWIGAAVLLAAGAFLVGGAMKAHAKPVYRRITFERGTIHSARFSPDGQGILYGASWNGGPLELYSTVGDSPLARPLGFSSAHMLALSRTNELALVLRGAPDRRDFVDGVLARAPLAGGTPRELLQDVRSADWSPRGELAVVHSAQGQSRLEFPVGKVLYQTGGWISDVRFSPSGEWIAFMDHPAAWDDRGSVAIVDLSGRTKTLASGWESENGLDWTPTGDEIWFTAAENNSSTRSLWAVNLKGKKRLVLALPNGMTLQNIAADGRVLATVDTEREAMEWTGTDSRQVRDLSWYDWSVARDLTPDGQWVLFEESSEPAGANYAVAIRKIDGSPPIRLGDGTVGNLSPDGKWAVSVFTGAPQHLALFPVGPGEVRQIFVPELAHLENEGAHFLPDGKRILVDGNQPGRPVRTFLLNLSGGKPEPITEEGSRAWLPSPDGKYLIEAKADRVPRLLPVAGGVTIPIPVPGQYDVVQWSADSKSLYVCRNGEVPLRIFKLDLATGAMTFLRELTPSDRAGVVKISPVITTVKASEYAYSYYQTLSVLFVISGLR